MNEAHAGVKLRIAGQPFLNPRHADQDERDFITIEQIAELLQARNLEPISFVDQDQTNRRQARLARLPDDLWRWLGITRRLRCEPVHLEKSFGLLSHFFGSLDL